MKNVLRAGVGLAALTMILASCGSVGVAGDGSGSVQVYDLKTEFKDQAGNYVACDNVAQQNGAITQQTAVATSFTVAGSVRTVTVELKGLTTSQYDGYYSQTVTGDQLASQGGNAYKLTFYANSSSGAYLPQSLKSQGIVVTPNNPTIYVKTVTTSNRVGGLNSGFYSKVTVDTGTATTSGTAIRTIPVYSGCNVVSVTGETL
ncbi:hypothetical protein [Deinococcus sp.]|uniref:hypothetical protein n=1 Tax=Deinococcus sp. TaxID=47478 RepID=UPI003C7BC83E